MARVLVLFLWVALAACHASKAFEHAQRAERAGDWDEAVVYYERARDEQPENVEYRMALDWARLQAAHTHMRQARKFLEMEALEDAALALERALGYDATNRYALDELAEIRRRQDTAASEEGLLVRSSPIFGADRVIDPDSMETIALHFPEGSSLRNVLEALAKLAGVSILFDESFRDKEVAVDLDGVTFREALDILMQTNGIFYKAVGSSSVLITSQK